MTRRASALLAISFAALSMGLLGAKDNDPVSAAKVSLQGESIRLSAALAELHKQTGNLVEDLRPRFGEPVPDPALALRIEGMPFWPALDEIARQGNVTIYPYTGKASVGIRAGKAHDPEAISYDGPFRTRIRRLATFLDLDSGNRYLTATLEIAWEPRYRPILLRVGPDSVKVRQGEGAFELIPQPGQGDVKLLGQQALGDLTLRLPAPPRDKPTLAELQGELSVLVPPEMLEFRLTGPSAGAMQEKRGVRVAVHRLQLERGLWTVGITLQYPREALDLESHQTWAADNEAGLEQNGRRVAPEPGREIDVQEGGVIKVTYRFANVPGKPADWTLVYKAPATPVRYPLKFVFKDLKLP